MQWAKNEEVNHGGERLDFKLSYTRNNFKATIRQCNIAVSRKIADSE